MIKKKRMLESDCLKTDKKIPKTIHYVWLGGTPKSEEIIRCIESWRRYMPDYEIIEWNEDNFNVNIIHYSEEAYKQKKWAFVSDIIRTYVLKEYGGIYFDTDIELFSSPGELFDDASCVLGFEGKFLLSSAMMASVPHFHFFERLWNSFENSHFTHSNLEYTINTRLTFTVVDCLNKRRLTNKCCYINDTRFLSRKYIADNRARQPIFAVHHFCGSWKEKTQLTFLQYMVFRAKFMCLRLSSVFMGNKKYIEINDYLWRYALKKTAENIHKKRKIYKIL